DLLADGLHAVRVESTDSAGNNGFAETVFTVDTIAPVVAITAPVAGPTGSRPVLAFTVSDGTVVVKVDGLTVNKVSGDALDQLTEGGHSVRVEATDVAGNSGYAEVNFNVASYAMVLNAGPNGSVTGPPSVIYGDMPSYVITPDAGYHIVDVAVNGTSVGAVSSYTFSSGITANTTISAVFAIDTFTVTLEAGANGGISGPATVTYGSGAAYSIAPAVGYHVADVMVDGVSAGAVTGYSLNNVTDNHTISATFAIDTFTVTLNADANGSIAGPATVTYGGSVSYTITPAVGYHVSD